MLLSLALVAGTGAHAADIQKGGALYATHCKSCHGVGGNPVMPMAPNFRRMERLMQPDMQLMASIRAGKGAMPAFFGVLREREILDVIAYLRTLS
jgi:cytochrome c6